MNVRTGYAGKAFALAASFSRRPWTQLSNRERLYLGVDDLFLLSARGQLPHLFQDFSGFLDGAGNARATIRIPRGISVGKGQTVFVAGIIFDGARILSATNTHWFEIP